MSKNGLIICMILFFSFRVTFAQNDSLPQNQSEKPFRFSGQLSGWAQYSPDISYEGWLGGRYIPQIDYQKHFKKGRLLDFEGSANIYGEMGFHSFDSITNDGKIKPYRLWTRFSNNHMELRLGLQKINFGSAQMFRPLMWFDRMDPRDPLQMTDGVWALLYRYYFLNNANVWLWGLYGNKDTKGWEVVPTSNSYPEAGGRIQLPVPKGEAALSYHFRMADVSRLNTYSTINYNDLAENRLGFDARFDVNVGLWIESSWTHLNKDFGIFTNQEMITLGSDYTFGIGNGLAATFEQLVYSNDRKAFRFDNTITFSGLNLSYPVGIFDNLSAIIYYDWKNNDIYNFINWQKQFNHFTFYLMGYWNPNNYNIPLQSGTERYVGKGLQLMVVWNH